MEILTYAGIFVIGGIVGSILRAIYDSRRSD